MSFRTRLALVAAAAVGIAVVAASVTVFIVVHNELFGRGRPRAVPAGQARSPRPDLRVEDGVSAHPSGRRSACRAISSRPFRSPGRRSSSRAPASGCPRPRRTATAARGGQALYYSTRRFQGKSFRVLTIPATPYAVQIARPLTEVTRTLHRITLFLILIAAGRDRRSRPRSACWSRAPRWRPCAG